MLSHTEENYLKAIYKIAEREKKSVSTNAISKEMQTTAASVTDMLKRLAEKEMINYQKYHGVSLSAEGTKIATKLIRKHRLWETFLVEKLAFGWEEVHEIAEQLEHIESDKLISKLDEYLDYPKFDPHGDPIPNESGKFTIRNQISLDKMLGAKQGVLVGVKEHSRPFLDYLGEIKLALGSHIEVLEKFEYDKSIKILINGDNEHILSEKICKNLFLKPSNN